LGIGENMLTKNEIEEIKDTLVNLYKSLNFFEESRIFNDKTKPSLRWEQVTKFIKKLNDIVDDTENKKSDQIHIKCVDFPIYVYTYNIENKIVTFTSRKDQAQMIHRRGIGALIEILELASGLSLDVEEI